MIAEDETCNWQTIAAKENDKKEMLDNAAISLY